MKANLLFQSALAFGVGGFLMSATESQAVYFNYSSGDRGAGLGDATSVTVGAGNVSAIALNDSLPSGDEADPWVERGSVNGGNAGPGSIADRLLTIEVVSGTWGSGRPLTGIWTINSPNFWTDYAFAAISLQVGTGNGSPDYWIWEITNGETQGTWNYEDFDGVGGGLSNLKLFSHGNGPASTVPEGGASLALLGLALAGLGTSRSLLRKS